MAETKPISEMSEEERSDLASRRIALGFRKEKLREAVVLIDAAYDKVSHRKEEDEERRLLIELSTAVSNARAHFYRKAEELGKSSTRFDAAMEHNEIHKEAFAEEYGIPFPFVDESCVEWLRKSPWWHIVQHTAWVAPSHVTSDKFGDSPLSPKVIECSDIYGSGLSITFDFVENKIEMFSFRSDNDPHYKKTETWCADMDAFVLSWSDDEKE